MNSISRISNSNPTQEIVAEDRPPVRPAPPVGRLKEKLATALEQAGIDTQALESSSESSQDDVKAAVQNFLGRLFQSAQGPPGGGPPGGGPPPGGGRAPGGPPPGGGYGPPGLDQGIQELAGTLGSEETAELEGAFSSLLETLGSSQEGDSTQQLKNVLENLSSLLSASSQANVTEGNFVSFAV